MTHSNNIFPQNIIQNLTKNEKQRYGYEYGPYSMKTLDCFIIWKSEVACFKMIRMMSKFPELSEITFFVPVIEI